MLLIVRKKMVPFRFDGLEKHRHEYVINTG
jgi:hypothetical protein